MIMAATAPCIAAYGDTVTFCAQLAEMEFSVDETMESCIRETSLAATVRFREESEWKKVMDALRRCTGSC